MDNLKLAIGGLPLPAHRSLSLGSRHPSTVGVVGVELKMAHDRVVAADVQPGYLHRGAEKLFEVRDYRSLIMLADRHDWLSSFSGELVVTLAVEAAMGLIPPPRVAWARTLLAECGRIHSHLSYLSYLSYLSEDSTTADLWDAVDGLRQMLLLWSGNRVHPMLNRVGGLAFDVPRDLDRVLRPVLRLSEQVGARLRESLDGAQARFQGLGIADAETCRQYGLSGPVARAAGMRVDVRQSGSLAYAEVFVATPIREEGDALSRFHVLLNEVHTSCEMVRRCLDGLPAGDFAVRLSRRLKVPEGEHLSEVEAPWGLASALLVSRGGPTPWRLSLRTPTFAAVSALAPLLVGAGQDHIADVVASMGHGIGDLDK